MEKTERDAIIRLVKREVVPAIGCTEPIAVALCVSKAAQLLGKEPEKIEVLLSANILKNAMGVGIPGTGMIGLPIAVALGALAGNPDYQLEVLKDITPADVERGKQFIAENRIDIKLKEDITEKLYIEIHVSAGSDKAAAIIAEQRKEIKGEPRNMEEQAISLVGRDIYQTLVKGYTEKQWGRSAAELPPSIIKRIPVRFTYDNNYFNDIYQGIPAEGYTALIEGLLEGVDVILGTDYAEERERWDSLGDKVLYTGCLDRLYGYAEGKLQYRSEIFEEERIEKENYQGVAVVNYTDRETPYTRIIEHKHFSAASSPVTWISREYPVDYEKTDEPFYPINDERNNALYARYRAIAEKDGLIIGGRLADYAYYDMDKTVREALKAAQMWV